MSERHLEHEPIAGATDKSLDERREALRKRGLSPQEIEETLVMSDALEKMGTPEDVENRSIRDEIVNEIGDEIVRTTKEREVQEARRETAWRDATSASYFLKRLLVGGFIPRDVPANELPAYLADLADRLRRGSGETENETN